MLAGCDDAPIGPETSGEVASARSGQGSGIPAGPHTFAPPVFDIAAGPNGNLLVPVTVFPAVDPPEEEGATSTSAIWEIRRNGDTRQIAEVTTVEGSPVNGLEANGQGNFLVTIGGLDLAVGAGLLRVSRGGQRLVGDIETFEIENDPDAFEGLEWKDQQCEGVPPFSVGPQSNPYHLARRSGGEALVGDAAGNTVLSVENPGRVDWVAILTPPTADGDIYVGELTGVTPTDIGLEEDGPTTGLSRVWRIDAGARHVVCPSAACEVVLSGFTSILDLAFGPDGKLTVVEYDENGWFTALEADPPNPAGGAVRQCDVDMHASKGDCDLVEDGLTLPAAVTFDKRGDLWVLENNLVEPTVRKLE